nr:hypothetical protein [uncultured Draconibacterium sp.]
MNSVDNNFLVKWAYAIDNVRHTTQSPFPDQDYYCAPKALPKCSNVPGYFTSDFLIDDVKHYLEEQVRILRFNNIDFDEEHIKFAITNRLFHWHGNNALKKDLYYSETLLPSVINDVFAMGDEYIDLIDLKYTVHWYSDEISKLPSHKNGTKWGERTKAKLKARTDFKAEKVYDRLVVAKNDYLRDNFNVLPTIQHLSHVTGCSEYEIKKFGEGLFIKKVENTKQLTKHFLEYYPDLPYSDIAEISNISVRSLKRYANNTVI